jgi:hypothetical protein
MVQTHCDIVHSDVFIECQMFMPFSTCIKTRLYPIVLSCRGCETGGKVCTTSLTASASMPIYHTKWYINALYVASVVVRNIQLLN